MKREYDHGYSTTRDLLRSCFNLEPEKDDFSSAARLTRARAMERSGTIMEDLGRDVAWVVYHTRHPVRAFRYRQSLRKE